MEPVAGFPGFNVRINVAELIIFFMGFVSCCLGPEAPISGILALCLFAAFVLREVIIEPHQLFKYLPFYFAACANMAGCAICEFSDVYLSELKVNASFAGSLPLLALSWWIFLFVLSWYDSFFGIESRLDFTCSTKRFAGAATWIVFAMLGLAFVFVFPNPSFAIGADRFAYAKTMPGLLNTAADWMGFIIIIPILAIKQSHSKIGVVSVVIYILYAVWTGNKFGTFYGLLYAFLVVFYDRIFAVERERLLRGIACLAIAFVVLISGAVTLNGMTRTIAWQDYLFQRTAQQGQLWWATYRLSDGGLHLQQLENEIDAAVGPPAEISDNVGSRYGIYGVMYLTAPMDTVDAKLASGSRYTEAGQAMAYYCLGTIGLIAFSVSCALLAAFVTNALIRSIVDGRLIESVFILRIQGFVRGVWGMGIVSPFFTSTTLLTIGFLFFMWLIRQQGNLRNLNRGSWKQCMSSGTWQLVDGRSFAGVPMRELLRD